MCIVVLVVYCSLLFFVIHSFIYHTYVLYLHLVVFFFFFKQKTAYEMRISDWSSDVCSSDLLQAALAETSEQARLARIDAEAANHAKSAFLARMSHELRTPLNAVLGFGQMIDLDRSNPLSPRQREYCGYILQSGRHLLDLINEVLDFASVEAGRLSLSPQRIAAADALASVATIMLPVAANAGVELRSEENTSE